MFKLGDVASLTRQHAKEAAAPKPEPVKTTLPDVILPDGMELAKLTPAERRELEWLQRSIDEGRIEGYYSTPALLTPLLAKALLQRNACNRTIRWAVVHKYANDIKEDRFDFNGEALIVADTGEMNTGQHRCLAVIEADKPLLTAISFGPKRETRHTTDNGTTKRSGDVLAMRGVPDSNNVAGVARAIWQFDKFKRVGRGNVSYKGAWPTQQQTADIALANMEEIQLCVKAARRQTILGPVGQLAFAHFLLRKHAKKERVQQFIGALYDGNNLSVGNPILVLRNRLIKGSYRGGGIPQMERTELIVRAWNAWAEGRTLTKLPTFDEIPEIVEG